MKDIPALIQGGAGVTFFAWSPLLSGGWNALIAVLGAAVLILTLYNRILETKQRRKALRNDEGLGK